MKTVIQEIINDRVVAEYPAEPGEHECSSVVIENDRIVIKIEVESHWPTSARLEK